MEFESPPKGLLKIGEWVREYLQQHHVAQQFTINGFTYLFVREMHFASLPYPINRKYSMLAGIFATRIGDPSLI